MLFEIHFVGTLERRSGGFGQGWGDWFWSIAFGIYQKFSLGWPDAFNSLTKNTDSISIILLLCRFLWLNSWHKQLLAHRIPGLSRRPPRYRRHSRNSSWNLRNEGLSSLVIHGGSPHPLGAGHDAVGLGVLGDPVVSQLVHVALRQFWGDRPLFFSEHWIGHVGDNVLLVLTNGPGAQEWVRVEVV